MNRNSAKRVILRVPETDMDYQNPREFVDFYFTKFPAEAASDPARHFIHYQPPSDIEDPQSNPKIHIVIDIETQEVSGETLSEDFPHEIYAARRGTSGLQLYAYPETVKENLIQKIRVFSDGFYPWARSRGDRELHETQTQAL
ncbi:uncharacterized protein DSM5745_02295 [Aspergillus mulundensis]|uniref:Uncharacterized protein n=1 Tax=Aspergillus mulundensis TaxID=1810919 RepID=A0A3D8SW45_9EURO|nr:Uncharacterized protein DSM5745_02295 [Aspergillus mulundensis]RDW90520.1 Uncharacterized protein DSM5745_02295 [Aspergillus mulundensis]